MAAVTSVSLTSHIRQLEQQGQFTESFTLREEALAALIQNENGREDDGNAAAAAAQAEELVRLYCCVAIDLLNRNYFAESFDLLMRAHHLVEQGGGIVFSDAFRLQQDKASAVVLNNLGLFYYRSGDYSAAVSYLRRAVAMEREIGESVAENPGATLLNLAQATIASEGVRDAVPLLQEAIRVLQGQAKSATVSVQVDDARNLIIASHALLGHCFEEMSEFHTAVTNFGYCLELLKSSPPDAVTSLADADSKKRRYLEDQRRCREKASRLPSVPLRSTKPVKQVAARDKRGTKANTLRLQFSSLHPALQHESIVTTTIGSSGLAAFSSSMPILTHQPTVPRQPARDNTTASLAPRQPQRSQRVQLPPAAAFASADPSPSPTVARGPEASAAAQVQSVPLKVEPENADDASLGFHPAQETGVPKATLAVLQGSDATLERIYGLLDPAQRDAFDSLARLSVELGPAANTKTFSKNAESVGSHKVFVENILFGGRRAAAASAGSQRTIVDGATELQPRNALHVPSRPTSARVRTPAAEKEAARSSHVRRATAASAVPTPATGVSAVALFSAASADGSLPNPAEVRNQLPTSSSTSSAAAALSAAMGPSQLEHESIGAMTTPVGVPVTDTSPTHKKGLGFAPSERKAPTRQHLLYVGSFVRAAISERVAKQRAAKFCEYAAAVLEIRDVEVARAQKEAAAKINTELARMQRLLDEAKLVLSSRRRSSEPLDLAPKSLYQRPIGSLHAAAAAVDGEADDLSVADLGKRVEDAIRVTVEQEAASRQSALAVQSLRHELSTFRVREEAKRSQNAGVLQRFAWFALARSVVKQRLDEKRTILLTLYSDRRLRDFAAARICTFMFDLRCHRREETKRKMEELAKQRLHASVQVVVSQYARWQHSSRVLQSLRTPFVTRAVTLIQACGRGYWCRTVTKFRLGEFYALREKKRELARLVVLRALRRNVRRVHEERRWRHVVSENMRRRSQYAATLIQAAYRRHRYGKPVEQAWRASLLRKQRLQELEMRERARAEAILRATRRIQRAYRAHLCRRQLAYRRLLRERERLAYLGEEWRNQAVRVLQRFSRRVAAIAEANRRRQSQNAELRLRRLLFDASAGPATPQKDGASGTAASSPAGTPRGRLRDSLASQSGIISLAKYASSRDPSSAADPSLFRFDGSSLSYPSSTDPTGLLPQLMRSTIDALLRRSDESDHCVSRATFVGTSDDPLQMSPVRNVAHEQYLRIRAGSIVLRFLRFATRRKRALCHREQLRRQTIRHEAAVFIQRAWRRYAAKRRRGARLAARRQ